MADMRGRTALVTGGSHGLGLAIAEAFAGAGADVVLLARDADRLATAADTVRRHGVEVRTLAVDLGDVTALYLASHEASWITGVVLPVDGGYTVR